MEKVMIIDGLRTSMGRSKNGIFRHVRAETLSAEVMSAVIKRNNINAADIDDIIWGCVQQTGEQGFNIARHAALLTDIPHTVPAVTVNRLCGSSMQALHDAARLIQTGDGKLALAGGVEHMGHIPMTHGIDINPAAALHTAKASGMMGLTAEALARQFSVSRESQDEFALRSHQRAVQAFRDNKFSREIHPVQGHNQAGVPVIATRDETVRDNGSLTELAALRPVFDPVSGTVTAGNSSAISDGASVTLLAGEHYAREHGLSPRAVVRAMSVTGCEPALMGYGPVQATQAVLKKAGLTLADIDVIELNEAFAAQALACLKGMGLSDCYDDKVNLHGGAIALGHPLGCSGTRIINSLLTVMEQRDAQFGLATMCIGFGQGIATVIERVRG
ncbi:TPA: acetyl-CoA C-acyltransferase FadA [Morganella morganii]|uniref:acetyl-CoA C-acyltransferase FadA n=1 Tax=Morganella morganii TaxID=582 RepID=UPI001A1FDD4D|nr:acetyl-CoA C-acyltransferase FadA [Morganella morganii]MCU6212642.1 acetyl-CoA C-acyltransferase FadA [Morganella morganii]HAT1512300.1 acetyl-CoA C-acyltransferase FadA [Morganella morganii]